MANSTGFGNQTNLKPRTGQHPEILRLKGSDIKIKETALLNGEILDMLNFGEVLECTKCSSFFFFLKILFI